MSWFANLRLGTKFNLIMSFLLLSLFVAAALLTYHRQQSLILKIAIDNARNFAKVIIETREYMSSVVRGEPETNYGLVPQVVATQVATRLTKDTSYYVRQISLRYRNPNNRPDAYEAQQLELFKGQVRQRNIACHTGQKGKKFSATCCRCSRRSHACNAMANMTRRRCSCASDSRAGTFLIITRSERS